jgi:hypothetical protein
MFNQSKAFAIGLLVAVLLAGIAIGATGSRWMMGHRAPPPRPNRAYADRLAQQLGLDSAQRDSVAGILRRYDPQMRTIFRSVEPQLDSLRERLRTEIRAQLTPAQRTTYQQLIERERARLARRDSASQRGDRHNDD